MGFLPQFVAAQEQEDAQSLSRGERPRGLFEDRLDRRLAQAALAWAWAHPRQVLALAAIKFARMWSPWPHARELGGFWTRLAVGLAYPPVLLLALGAGCRAIRRQQWDWLLLWAPAVYLTLLHVVFVSSLRYRMPAMLPLMVLAAAALEGWWTGRRDAAARTALGTACPQQPGS
jgi:hypothetical protein